MIFFATAGFLSYPALVVFIIIGQFATGTYWTIYYSMMYDIGELDEFI